MNDRESFLRAIHADRRNDLLKRQFADWLEEHGEGEMAEYIRLRCDRREAGEASERERELLDYLGGEVMVPTVSWTTHYQSIYDSRGNGVGQREYRAYHFQQAPADVTLRRVFGSTEGLELVFHQP